MIQVIIIYNKTTVSLFLAKVLPLLLISFLSQADIVISLGAGINTNLTGGDVPWESQDSLGGVLSIEYRADDYACGWAHYSQWFIGPPFNNRDESSLDHFGCRYEWRY